MKKKIFFFLLVLLFISVTSELVPLFLRGCRERMAYRHAANRATIESYGDYLRNYPDGRFVDHARQIYDSLYVIHILTLGEIDTLKLYLDRNPESRFRDSVVQKMETLYPRIAINIEIGPVWHNFLSKNDIKSQILARLDSIAKYAGFSVVEQRQDISPSEYWGKLVCSYSETESFGYMGGFHPTHSRLLMRMTDARSKSTWESINANYINPEGVYFGAITDQHLRKESYEALWQNVPALIIPSGKRTGMKKSVILDGITQPMLASSGDTLFFFLNNNLMAFSVSKRKIFWQYRLPEKYRFRNSMDEILEAYGFQVLISTGDDIIALDARTGREAWRFSTDSTSVWGIQRTPNGYLVSMYEKIIMLNPESGQAKWKREINDTNQIPLVSLQCNAPVDDEYAYCFSEDNLHQKFLHRISLDSGKVVQRCPFEFFINLEDALCIGDTLIIALGKGISGIMSLSKSTGTIYWYFNVDDFRRSNLIYQNSRLYFAGEGGFLYCLNTKDGRLFWKLKYRNVGSNYEILEISIADGILYLPSDTGHLYWINPQTGKCIWFEDIGVEINGEGPLVLDGRIYIIASDALYCFY